jgi:fluoroacetyl-CoA thioesterase
MKDSLVPGISMRQDTEVTAAMAPPHLPMAVLGTPMMVQLMEAASLFAIQPHLDDHEASVGTHVCFSHVGAAREGETVSITAHVTGIVKRRVTFECRAVVGDRLIGEGTHERAVIDTTRFGR